VTAANREVQALIRKLKVPDQVVVHAEALATAVEPMR